jgi:hypothetical protein
LVARDPELDPSRWFAFGGDQRAFDGAEKSVVGLIDREGRLRQLTLVPSPAGGVNQEIEGMQVVDGRMFVDDRSNVLSVGPRGDVVVAPPVRLDPPYLTPSHHQGYRVSALHYWTLFNLSGAGLECDLQTPTDDAIGDGVAELDATGAEVWRWTVFDHPDKFPPADMSLWVCEYDPTFWGPGAYDWTHANNVAPCPGEEAFLISLRHLSQIAKVSRDAGEVIWQMGKERDFTWVGSEPALDRWFSFQHDPHWIAPQRLLMFDNGNCRYNDNCSLGPWSRALELAVDEDGRTVKLVWEHRTPFSGARGNVERLPNGDTFINTGFGNLFYEVTPDHRELWEVVFPEALRMGWARSYNALWEYEE